MLQTKKDNYLWGAWMQKLSFSLTSVASLLVGFQAFAVDVGVEVNSANPTFTNNSSLTTKNGYDVWINGEDSFDAIINNLGSLNVSGSGFGIYATPFPTRGGTVSVANRGTIQRIQLEEIDAAYILNNINTDTEAPAVIQGSVLLGTNAIVENFSGVFENLSTDTNRQKGNLISFASNGFFNNGVETVYSTNEDGEKVLADLILHPSTVTTDKIQFGANGLFSNGGTVDSKSLKMGDDATIMNVSDPFIQHDAGKLIPDGASFKVDNILLSNNALIHNEMGASFKADYLSALNDAYIENGSDYEFMYLNEVTVVKDTEITIESSTTDSDGTDGETSSSTTTNRETESYPIPAIPHTSNMEIRELDLKDGGTIVNKHGSTYKGETISFGNKGVLDIQSGSVILDKENGKSSLIFMDEGIVSVGVSYQPTVKVPIPVTEEDSSDASDTSDNSDTSDTTGTAGLGTLGIKNQLPSGLGILGDKNPIRPAETTGDTSGDTSGDTTGDTSGGATDPNVNVKIEYETVLEGSFQPGVLKADEITMKDYGSISANGGSIEAEKITMGDHATLSVMTATVVPTEEEFYPEEEEEESDSVDPDYDISDDELKDIIEDILGGILSSQTPTQQTPQSDASDTSDTSDETDADDLEPKDFVGSVSATEGIYLGHFGTLNMGGTIDSPIVKMLDDGTVNVYDTSEMNTLDMGKRSQINAMAKLTADILLDSDSNVLLTDPEAAENGAGGETGSASDVIDDDILDYPLLDEEDGQTQTPASPTPACDHCKEAGAIYGSLNKKDGASNVTVTVQVSEEYFAKLNGQINVDSILIDQGLLEVAGDIKGDIYLNTDTTLRITGTDMYIHDPITRLENTTNTTLEVELPDEVFYETTNLIDVENLLVKNGGISINKPVLIDNILLNHDTTVRLTGNFNVGEIKEMNGDAVNTTLQIEAGTGKSINSSGTVHVDRLLISSGNYNAFHEISVAPTSGVVTIPQSEVEGVELGTDASLTAHADISVNRIMRDREAQDVQNTSLNVYSDHFQVKGDVDVDNLNMNGGVFEFLNDAGSNVVNVTNDIQLKPYSSLAGSGLLNVKSGNLDISQNSRLAVSMQDFDETPVSTLNIVSSNQTIENAEDSYSTKGVTLTTDSSSYIDVRANGAQNDKIDVDGTVRLADGTRIVIRNIQENQEYDILTANDLEANADKLRTSFLWKGTSISTANDTLSLKITGLQTLKEGIQAGKPSKNVENLVDMMDSVRDSIGQYAIDPFLDNVYFAQTSEEAVEILNEYSPEGYLNTAQASLRLQKVFKESVLSEMNAMRNYRVKHDMNNRYYYVPSPAYYGRPGREQYYQSFRRNRYNPNPYQERRTDRGGIWAKPFMVSLSQDDKDNQSGYDFDSYGFTAGIDRKVGVLTLGLAAMYATGEMEQKNKNMTSDLTTYGIGAYGSITPHYSRYFMNFYALWAQTSSSSTREIASLAEKAKADFDVTAYTFGGDIGYEIMLSQNFIITPKVGIDFTSISIDDIEEKGSGRALAHIKGTDYTSLQTPVELKAMLDFGDNVYRFRPEAHVRWTHEFMDTAAESEARFVRYATPFVTEGLNVDKDTFTIGASLLWIYGLSELELKYDYDFSSTSTGHSINVGYKYLF